MATGKALNGKPYAGNPHVRFDEGEVAPAATPRRGSLLYSFEDIAAVLGQAFGMELKVVQNTTVFEVASDDGSTKVQVLLQNTGERNLVLMSADLGEAPPEGREKLFQTMLEANNMFSGTVGSTLALDAASGNARLQRYVSGDDLANNVMGMLEPFIETALLWSRMIADYRPSVDSTDEPVENQMDEWRMQGLGSFHVMQV